MNSTNSKNEKDNVNNDTPESEVNECENAKRTELETPKICKNLIEKDEDFYFSLQKRIRLSAQKEYDDLLKSAEFIRNKFLVKMPPDFFYFWDFLNNLKPDTTGENILKYIENTFQLQLVGPFEYVGGRFHGAKLYEPGDYLRHWRFFFDPPEFQTIFVKKNSELHYGYWRDDPKDDDSLLIARNDCSKSCTFDLIAGNTFEAFIYYLQTDFEKTPFNSQKVKETIKAINKYLSDNKLELDNVKALQKKRNTTVVTKTFHRAGIVVPYDNKTQLGYRPLIASESELKKILKLFESSNNKDLVMEQLQPIATAASIALDECDFGTALELGINLFCSGYTELHGLIHSLLIPAYKLLNRPQFLAIFKAHSEKRCKGNKLSIFDI